MRTCTLDDPIEGEARVAQLVEMLAAGEPNTRIAEAFAISERTVTEWRKREDVQRLLTRALRERANRVRSLADSELLGRLTNEEARRKLSVDQILKIQQAFPLEAGDDAGDAASVLQQLMEAAHKNPELAQALQDALPGGSDGV